MTNRAIRSNSRRNKPAERLLSTTFPIPSGLNQSKNGIYIDTGLGRAVNAVVPADAGIQRTLPIEPSRAPANAGVTKAFAPSGWAN